MKISSHIILSAFTLATLLGCEPIETNETHVKPDTTRPIVIANDCTLAMSENMTREYILKSVITNISQTADSIYDERTCGFVDLNHDGIDDLILSAPLSRSGSGGNDYAIILAEGDHFRHVGDICGNVIHVECAPDEPTTIWSFSHSSASSGSVLTAVIEYNGDLILSGRIPIVLQEGSVGTLLLEAISKQATTPITWKRSKTVNGIVHWQ